MHQLYCRKLINWCRNQVCTRTPRGEQTTHWRKERTKGPKGHTAVSASEVWIETLGLNTKARVRRWSFRHHHNAIQSDVYVLYILFERITWERRMSTAWLEINYFFVKSICDGRPWHGRIAGRWYRSSSKRLEDQEGTREILPKAHGSVVSKWDHEIIWDWYLIRFRFSWAFHTFCFPSGRQDVRVQWKLVDPFIKGGSGLHAVWCLADEPPGSDEKWRDQGRISMLLALRFIDGRKG